MMPDEMPFKVRLLKNMVIGGSVWFRGDVVEVPLNEAREMVDAGLAEEVTPMPPLPVSEETETDEEPEEPEEEE